ncbi:MAG: STAS domain-containing protein [Leptolyngbyaceae cyanobacterium bins.59]|nr:STAS domain-containing protein [Leptolyngbyaceae cyanobacterium bins.59]
MSLKPVVFQPTRILSSTTGLEIVEQVQTSLEDGDRIFLIDLSDVLLMDSTGLGCLVNALEKVQTANGQLYLCSLKGQAAMLFELANMGTVFQVFRDRAAFNHYIAEQ